jgi:biotin operon repressor
VTQHVENANDLARLLKVIADETRLRILGALADKPLTGKDLAEQLSLTAPTISHHMRKLSDAGIVLSRSEAQRQWYSLNSDLLLGARRVPLNRSDDRPSSIPGDDDEDSKFRAKVLRDFFVGEALKEIPAQRKKRVIVLQHLMDRFDPSRTHTEREVNDLLRPAHEDVATLRRELVDYGYLQRDRGIYQVSRAGPIRTKQIAQEITGREATWLQSLLAQVISSDNSTTKDVQS